MKILCYGDSNTYGYDPRDGGRYAPEFRWPDVMRETLRRTPGLDADVSADGMNGRTIDTTGLDADGFDLEGRGTGESSGDPASAEPFFRASLRRALPVDLLILMLGTNNCFGPDSVEKITAGLARMIRIARASGVRDVLIIAPPLVGGTRSETSFLPFDVMRTGAEKSRKLAERYRILAGACGAEFLDASEAAGALSFDQTHLTEQGHVQLGRAVAGAVLARMAQARQA